jgi:hypothetical protein
MNRVWRPREQRDRHCSICPPFPTQGRTQVRALGRTGDGLPNLPRHIKKALMKEQGVAGVTVCYEKKELIVSFDDAKTTPDAS